MSEWISVDDRLPELIDFNWGVVDASSGEVLIAFANINGEDTVSWGELLSYEGRIFWGAQDDEYGYFEVDNVTHWQPYPKHPEEA